MADTPVDPNRCPDCGNPVFYEKQGTGMFKFHFPEQRGAEPEFLCPESLRLITK
jgi:hypothetical protein